MQVTVNGGMGKPPAVVAYNPNTQAYLEARNVATAINAHYSSPVYYNPADPPTVPASGGYLIIKKGVSSSPDIQVQGFGAVVDENNGVPSTLHGGGAAGGQLVLAGNGGLTY